VLTGQFVDAYNADLNHHLWQPTNGENFQIAHLRRMDRVEADFDTLTAGQGAVWENNSFTVYSAVNMGNYSVSGAFQPVVAQTYRDVRYARTNRVARSIRLFAIGDEDLPLESRFDLAAHDVPAVQKVGEASIDSSKRRALPVSVGNLDQFSELLKEVIEHSKN
jgi:hypothetical protein